MWRQQTLYMRNFNIKWSELNAFLYIFVHFIIQKMLDEKTREGKSDGESRPILENLFAFFRFNGIHIFKWVVSLLQPYIHGEQQLNENLHIYTFSCSIPSVKWNILQLFVAFLLDFESFNFKEKCKKFTIIRADLYSTSISHFLSQ